MGGTYFEQVKTKPFVCYEMTRLLAYREPRTLVGVYAQWCLDHAHKYL